MSGVIVAVVGALVLALGLVSRRPWGRWWQGGSVLAEQFATLMAPPLGLFLLVGGTGTALGERNALYTPLLLVGALAFLAMLWVLFSLPVPDRLLVKDSAIRQDRVRRRARRRKRRQSRKAS